MKFKRRDTYAAYDSTGRRFPLREGRRKHTHVVESEGPNQSIATDHAEWKRSNKPCLMCGKRAKE